MSSPAPFLPSARSDSAWRRFHAALLDDETLHSHLLATPDNTPFREAVFALAAQHGLVLRPEELDAAIDGARRAWLIRQVVMFD